MIVLGIVVSILYAYVGSLFLPWWGVLLGPFVYCMMTAKLKAGKASFIGFWAIALLWLLLMLKESAPNGFIAASSMADIMGVGSTGLLMAATALMGGILGALSGWTGQALRGAVR